jgi:hypothetical protein
MSHPIENGSCGNVCVCDVMKITDRVNISRDNTSRSGSDQPKSLSRDNASILIDEGGEDGVSQ